MDADFALRGDEFRTESVYGRLREAILSGEIAGDAPISQVQLAKRLGVSRTPLREALRMLQGEGLIQSEPNRRVRVTSLSVNELDDTYAQRILLETLAARLSAPQFTDEDVAHLESLVLEMDSMAGERDFDRWEVPHRAYHDALRKYAGERFGHTARDLAGYTERYRRVYLAQPRTYDVVGQEHEEILEAYRERDGDLAGDRLARHLARTALAVVAAIAPDHDPAAVRMALRMAARPTTEPAPAGRRSR